ncbi:MAG: hypothetical protein ACFFAE_21565 [Candidatus Hodarchaeota archaeon]
MIEIMRITAGAFILFAYINPRQVIETKRVDTVIMIWRILGASILIPGVINFISYSSMFILQITIIEGVWLFVDFVGISSNYILVILTIYVAVRYPEFLLVSEAQILRACKLYVKVRVLEEPRTLEQWGLEQIKTYVQSIPASIFEDACPETEIT